jgi:hypothetical protein
MANARYVLVGTLINLLAASFPGVAAARHTSDASLSGDDIYDPASPLFSSGESEIAGLDEAGLAFSGGCSGDDAYDPAASGLYESFLFVAEGNNCDDPSGFASVGSFGGDDAYDRAAGGIPSNSLNGHGLFRARNRGSVAV